MRKLKLHSTDEKIEDFTEIVWGHRGGKSARKGVWKLIADPFLRLTSQLRPVCWALLPWRSSGCLQRPAGVEIRGCKLGDSSPKILSSRYFITSDTPSLPAAYNNKRNQTWCHIYVSKKHSFPFQGSFTSAFLVNTFILGFQPNFMGKHNLYIYKSLSHRKPQTHL